ncbi:hypothetical protein OHC95_24995 [Escherichia coli]|nr:hypothetical protein [Escherichia coli]
MHYAEFQAEATANGIQTGSMTIDYHDAIRRLDAGEFDTLMCEVYVSFSVSRKLTKQDYWENFRLR